MMPPIDAAGGDIPRISIIGSCVSADAFYGRKDIAMGLYLARTSLASQVAPPCRDDAILEALDSPFQRRILRADMEKSAWDMAAEGAYDRLVVDFIDNRFDMLRLPGGAIHTVSAEYLGALRKLGRTLDKDAVISRYSDEKWALWRKGWDRLAGILAEGGRLDRVLINRVRYASHDKAGQPLKGQPFAAENAWLDRLYDHVRGTCPRIRFLQYPAELMVADGDHRWGLSPFHYVAGLYDSTVAQIRAMRD